jgi:hypothetical protein
MAKIRSNRKSSNVKQQLAQLRRKGLTRAKPKGRPGGSVYATLKKLSGVLEGRARPVKLTKQAKEMYKGVFPIVKGKAIVPAQKSERLSVSRKTGKIYRRVKSNGGPPRRFEILSKKALLSFMEETKGSETTVYRLTTKQGAVFYRIGLNSLREWLDHNYDFAAFMQSIEVVGMEDME